MANVGHFQRVGDVSKVSRDSRSIDRSYKEGTVRTTTGGRSGRLAILPLLSKDTPKAFSFVTTTCMLEISKQIVGEVGCGNRNDNHRSDDVQCTLLLQFVPVRTRLAAHSDCH